MFNHTRGLWGYTGRAPDGQPLTVQATGMGGPSTAIVVEELIDLGARSLVRIGTCGALVEGLGLGEIVVAGHALTADGTSRALGAGERAEADAGLSSALAAGGLRTVTAATADLFYDPDAGRARGWVEAGASVVEMEAATLFTVARLRGVAAGAVLGVTDLLAGGGRERIEGPALETLGVELGRAGWAGLGAVGGGPTAEAG